MQTYPKNINFLFVVPKFAPKGQFYFFPFGMGYVISSLKKAGFNVFCLNLCHDDRPAEEQIVDSVEKNKIDVICTGGMTIHWNLIKDILCAVKKHYPGKITIVGGPIITADPETAMDALRMDFGVIGEGEVTMPELADAICRGETSPSVNGIIYHSPSAGLVKTPERETITDLDALPFPDYEALGYDEYLKIRWNTLPSIGGVFYDADENQRLGEILTSRSCPYSCTFCYHPLGKKYRQRSLDNVFQEIDYLVRHYDIRLLNVLDELFSFKKERILEFCQRIKPYKIDWMAQWRVDNIDEDLLLGLKDSGLVSLGLGIESMSDIVLKSMKKHTTTEKVNRAFELTSKVGIRAGGNLIFGDINETDETANESLKWFYAHPEYDIHLAMIISIPDSEVWRYTVEKGFIVDKINFYESGLPIFNFSKMTKKMYRHLVKLWLLESSHCLTMRGILKKSRRLPDKIDGKNIYSFDVECPLCHTVSNYKYYSFSATRLTPVLCKKCMKKLTISTLQTFCGEPGLRKEIVKNEITYSLRSIYLQYLLPVSWFRYVWRKSKSIFR